MANSSKPSSSAQRLEQIVKHFNSRNPSKKLTGKVCILTGVGHEQGIGWATALLFAKEDAKHLYLLDSKGDKFSDLRKVIQSANERTGVSTFTGDAADEGLIQSICKQAINEYGHLDVFFANAGVATGAPLDKTTYETAERSLRVNTMSCWLALKYGSQAMLKEVPTTTGSPQPRGGSIIFTSSVAGIRSGAGSMDYSASKAAVMSLASTGANAYPGSAIRVNAVCPGMIQTQMTGPVFQLAKDKSKIGQLCSLRRYAIAEEVASVVLFLASDDSSYVTGAAIPVDGGLSSSLPVIPGKSY